MIPAISKSTCVTRHTAATIDHIFTNTVINGIQHRSGIIKTDTSDNFPIAFALKHVKKVSLKMRRNLFINGSTKKNK